MNREEKQASIVRFDSADTAYCPASVRLINSPGSPMT